MKLVKHWLLPVLNSNQSIYLIYHKRDRPQLDGLFVYNALLSYSVSFRSFHCFILYNSLLGRTKKLHALL